MPRPLSTTALLPLLLLLAPGIVLAAEGAPVAVSGFVDSSLRVPAAGYPEGARGVVLGLDQVEVDVIAAPASGVTVRADLNWFPALTVATFDDLVEQGLVRVELGGDFFVQAGKANAPFGVEAVDPVDMVQPSHGLLFDYATPANLTGFFAGWASDSVDAQLFVTNDWDTPETPGGATVGGRFAYHFSGGSGVGVSTLYGPVDDADPRFVIDADLTLALGDLTLWAEGNLNRTDHAQAVGFLIKGRYAFGDLAAVLRLSYLSADDGIGDLGGSDLEVTGALGFPITTGVRARIELRVDAPEVGDPRVTAAFQLIGAFGAAED
ncbi:MAG: hypothetical protein EP329_07895 [Deltaproteobacteria bacterium]|nr:MAG: hypothetical protein EP329_07895 [Deltaproteobacteria bacterium]